MSDTVRVCLIAPLPPPAGGMTTWTGEVVNAAAHASGVDLVVIDSALRKGPVVNRSKFMRLFGGIVGTIGLGARLVHHILRSRPHVVHVASSGHLSLARDLMIIKLAHLLHVPTVFHAHFGRLTEILQLQNWECYLLDATIRNADRVIILESSSLRAVEARGTRTLVIPNPIQLPTPTEACTPGSFACFAGWLTSSKGVEDLLAAWSMIDHVDTQGNSWRLRLIGPSTRRYLGYLRVNFSFKDVDILGELPHDQVLNQLGASGFVVLPSHTEGFPYVVLEAMVRRKAVIATRVGGIPDMLADASGCLVDVGDRDSLAAQMRGLIVDSDRREELGMRSFLRASREYHGSAVFERYLNEWVLLATGSRKHQ